MKTAIGTKVIRFESMTQKEFYERFKHSTGDVTPQNIEGYHVQYDNPGGSMYDSWSPKRVFDDAYTDVSGDLDFGQAYFLMKHFGKKCSPDCRVKGFCVFMKDGAMYCNCGVGGIIEKFYPDDEDLEACWSVVDA